LSKQSRQQDIRQRHQTRCKMQRHHGQDTQERSARILSPDGAQAVANTSTSRQEDLFWRGCLHDLRSLRETGLIRERRGSHARDYMAAATHHGPLQTVATNGKQTAKTSDKMQDAEASRTGYTGAKRSYSVTRRCTGRGEHWHQSTRASPRRRRKEGSDRRAGV
jgi:hypothetical protein